MMGFHSADLFRLFTVTGGAGQIDDVIDGQSRGLRQVRLTKSVQTFLSHQFYVHHVSNSLQIASKAGFPPDLESTRMWDASLEKAKQPSFGICGIRSI
jgi:hypothetical protein